ncbi:MAG: hypothetical protein K940chlam9_00327 [Chlamydiae bacterium]|nr:hypothetical protein [Chlamydiota bacterium]
MSLIESGFGQGVTWNGGSFFPEIYDGRGEVPSSFNVGRVHLDASLRSLLRWEEELSQAIRFVRDGKALFWELDFGRGECLGEEEHYLPLELASRHFVEKVYPDYCENTFGVGIYRGELPSDSAYRALRSLGAFLPENAPLFLLLDTSSIEERSLYFSTLSPFAYGPFSLAIRGEWQGKYPYAFPSFSWDSGPSPWGYIGTKQGEKLASRELPTAICLPEGEEGWKEIEKILDHLGDKPFRAIPERVLTHEWDGVERLYVPSRGISFQGERKLRGFLAAGGHIERF